MEFGEFADLSWRALLSQVYVFVCCCLASVLARCVCCILLGLPQESALNLILLSVAAIECVHDRLCSRAN